MIAAAKCTTLEKIKGSDTQLFDSLYNIYITSIAESERKLASDLKRDLNRPEYSFLVLKLNDKVIGFSIVFIPDIYEFALLEYMAIEKTYRGGGYGTELFHKTVKYVNDTAGRKNIILEVDSEQQESSDHQERLRRIEFYRRQGCVRIQGLKYLLPLKSRLQPPEMNLLLYPVSSNTTISKATLNSWIAVIYSSVYGESSSDARIGTMMMGLTNPLQFGW